MKGLADLEDISSLFISVVVDFDKLWYYFLNSGQLESCGFRVSSNKVTLSRNDI
jgi:hypothetical protein